LGSKFNPCGPNLRLNLKNKALKIYYIKAYVFSNVDGSESGHVWRYFVDGEPDVVQLAASFLFAVACCQGNGQRDVFKMGPRQKLLS
jgi:hypothetical protein